MENNKFEAKLNSPENFSRNQLQEKLESLKEERQQILDRAFEFYDQQMYDLYVSSSAHFMADSERQKLYINASGFNYDEVLQNYRNFESFCEEQLRPIEQKIENTTREINKIKNQETVERNKQIELDAESKFKKEKDDLLDALYGALDAIHSQIPSVAHDVGMSTEVAIKTYLPGLAYRAQRIESYIGRVEEAVIPYHLSYIKRDLEGDDILKK